MEVFPDITNYLEIFKFISESDPKEIKLFALIQTNFIKYYLYEKKLEYYRGKEAGGGEGGQPRGEAH